MASVATIYGTQRNDTWRAYLTFETSETADSFTVHITALGVNANGGYINYPFSGVRTATGKSNGNYSERRVSISKGASSNFTDGFNLVWDKTHSTQSITVSFKLTNEYNGLTSTASATLTIPKKTSYTVSYNANGGNSTPSSQTKWYGEDITAASAITKTGYTFYRWKDLSRDVLYQAGGTISYNGSQTLTAQWTANTYTVSYNANGGSGAPSSQTKTYGVNLTLSSTKPTRSGYTFKGWGTSSTTTTVSYASGATYTKNAGITLYAIWSKTLTLSYGANGGSGAPSSQSATIYNATTSYKFTISSTKPTRTNYTFLGWSLSSTATSASYQPGGTITLSANDTLYAVWKINYVPPVIKTTKAFRCDSSGTSDDEGTYGSIRFTWTPGKNGGTTLTPTVTAKYKLHTASSWTNITLTVDNTNNVATAIFGGSLTDAQYDVMFSVQDSGQTAVTYTTYISAVSFVMDVNATGTAVSFFAPAPDGKSGLYLNGSPIFLGGRVSAQGAQSANTYKDIDVSFGQTFASAPHVIVCFDTNSSAGNFGRCQCGVLTNSITTTGFTIRWFNGDDSSRNPGFRWIALAV